jgi:hypothetical protein
LIGWKLTPVIIRAPDKTEKKKTRMATPSPSDTQHPMHHDHQGQQHRNMLGPPMRIRKVFIKGNNRTK